ncbi:hypothetical protein HDU96_008761 [Phlyctochytrium bullatum]|nr:hypothetical protein HDU96_008761 [Phlyctochytrium bullatum]
MLETHGLQSLLLRLPRELRQHIFALIEEIPTAVEVEWALHLEEAKANFTFGKPEETASTRINIYDSWSAGFSKADRKILTSEVLVAAAVSGNLEFLSMLMNIHPFPPERHYEVRIMVETAAGKMEVHDDVIEWLLTRSEMKSSEPWRSYKLLDGLALTGRIDFLRRALRSGLCRLKTTSGFTIEESADKRTSLFLSTVSTVVRGIVAHYRGDLVTLETFIDDVKKLTSEDQVRQVLLRAQLSSSSSLEVVKALHRWFKFSNETFISMVLDAVRFDRSDLLPWLLQHCTFTGQMANPRVRSIHNAIDLAIEFGKSDDIVYTLMDMGISYSWRALFFSVKYGRIEGLKEAAKRGDLRAVKLYLDAEQFAQQPVADAASLALTAGHLNTGKHLEDTAITCEDATKKFVIPGHFVAQLAGAGHYHVMRYILSGRVSGSKLGRAPLILDTPQTKHFINLAAFTAARKGHLDVLATMFEFDLNLNIPYLVFKGCVGAPIESMWYLCRGLREDMDTWAVKPPFVWAAERGRLDVSFVSRERYASASIEASTSSAPSSSNGLSTSKEQGESSVGPPSYSTVARQDRIDMYDDWKVSDVAKAFCMAQIEMTEKAAEEWTFRMAVWILRLRPHDGFTFAFANMAVWRGRVPVLQRLRHGSESTLERMLVDGGKAATTADTTETSSDSLRTLRDCSKLGPDTVKTAAMKNDLEMVKFLHSCSVPITSEALEVAASKGHLEVSRYLAEADENIVTEGVLIAAAETGNLELLSMLVDRLPDGTDPTLMGVMKPKVVWHLLDAYPDADRIEALNIAVRHGHVDVALFLADVKKPVDAIRKSTRHSRVRGLKIVARKGDMKTVQDYLAAERFGQQQLADAASLALVAGHLEIGRRLVDAHDRRRNLQMPITEKPKLYFISPDRLVKLATAGHHSVMRYILSGQVPCTNSRRPPLILDTPETKRTLHLAAYAAAQNGKIDVLAAMVDLGVKLNVPYLVSKGCVGAPLNSVWYLSRALSENDQWAMQSAFFLAVGEENLDLVKIMHRARPSWFWGWAEVRLKAAGFETSATAQYLREEVVNDD